MEKGSEIKREKVSRPLRPRPLQTLLPAKPWYERPDFLSRLAYLSKSNRQTRLQKCGLVQCLNVPCKLKTHHLYAAALQARKSQTLSGDGGQRPLDNALAKINASDANAIRLNDQWLDELPELPIKTQYGSPFQELIRHYFTDQASRLVRIYTPMASASARKTQMFQTAFVDPTLCVCLIANAQTDRVMRGRARVPDRQSEIVYSTTAQALRNKLDTFDLKDVDWLLVLVVALVGFDLSFQRFASLAAHREAIRKLVELKGGLHAIGDRVKSTVPYVLDTDRFIALFTGQYPLFTPPVPPSVLHLPARSTGRYGSVFQTANIHKVLDQEVVQFCVDECRCIHHFEVIGLSFDSDSHDAAHPALPYFLYLRDHLQSQLACLHAQYLLRVEHEASLDPKSVRSRCVVLTAPIIEYLVVLDEYYTVKRPFLAQELRSILDESRSRDWLQHVDLMIWILFVLTTVASWSGHGWALESLRQWLIVKYDGAWPFAGWRDHELDQLCSHVWAKARLEAIFTATCDQLELLQNDSMSEVTVSIEDHKDLSIQEGMNIPSI